MPKVTRPKATTFAGLTAELPTPEEKPFRNKAIRGNRRRQFALGFVPACILFLAISAFIWGWKVSDSPIGGLYILLVPAIIVGAIAIPFAIVLVLRLCILWMIVEGFGIEANRETFENVKEMIPTSGEAVRLLIRSAMYRVVY